MKKVFQVICCAAGAGMIGFFANQLNTVVGCVFFTLGIALQFSTCGKRLFAPHDTPHRLSLGVLRVPFDIVNIVSIAL